MAMRIGIASPPMGIAETGATAITCDVTDRGDIERAYGEARAANGPFDFVILNAGIGDSAPFLRTQREAWDRIKTDYETEPRGEPVPNSMDTAQSDVAEADEAEDDEGAAGEADEADEAR